MAHIAVDYGISESTVSRTTRKIEDVLTKSEKFSLSQLKKLYYEDGGLELEYIRPLANHPLGS